MIAQTDEFPMNSTHRAAKATALALRLAQAENMLQMLTLGKVDAIVDTTGQTYLLRPAQEHLRQNERRLQDQIDSVADVITVVDRAGVIVSQSRAAKRVIGYEQGELVGINIFELVHEDNWSSVYAAFLSVSEGFEETSLVRFRHLARDGSFRMIEATVGKLSEADPARVIFSFRPTSRPVVGPEESMWREAARTEASLARGRFLAMLSHELRTPLNPVSLGVEELQEDERFAEARPILAMMRRNIELQSRLLEELTDFTSIGQHKLRLKMESIDMHEVVHFVLEICKAEIAAAQTEVILALNAANNMVMADSARLQQVMWNLLKNAIKFSGPGSKIYITSANCAPGRLSVEFVDHGIGIDAELLPLVFDPFQQGDQRMQQLYGGLGLGLFIAKGLVEAQEGTLTAASEGRGKGATFCLRFKTAP